MSDEYKIEKGIPIPKKVTRESKFPFKSMVIGDSFLTNSSSQTVIVASYRYRRKIEPEKFKITIRVEGKSKSMIRVWRVE